MKDKNQYESKILLRKYLAGECTEEEKALIEQWYLTIGNDSTDLEVEQVLADIRELDKKRPWSPVFKLKVKQLIYKVAAVILITITLGILWTNKNSRETNRATLVMENDLQPGSNKAILTIEGGPEIELNGLHKSIMSDGNTFKYGDGTSIKTMENIRMVTVATPVAGQYEVVLPDGTKVWLNARSSITYPSSFESDRRKVKVTGEVYLEVMKNLNKPFIVEVDKQQIEVLGTSFNVDAYGDKGKILTTLTEGSLRISHNEFNSSVILMPGQQAQVIDGLDIKVKEVNTKETSSWREGLYIVNSEELEMFAKKIERWYDVQMDVGVYGQKRLSAIIPRNANLSSVLEAIELKTGVTFEIKGRRVTAVK